MKITLNFDPALTIAGGAFGAAIAAGTAFALTAFNPLHAAIYGLATGIFAAASGESLGKSGNAFLDLGKRSIEYIASSAISLACLKLAGIPLAAKTAALLSGAILTTIAVIVIAMVVIGLIANSKPKPEPIYSY